MTSVDMHFAQLESNRRLHVVDNNVYKGMELLSGCGPYVKEYLDALLDTVTNSLTTYPKLLAIRLDLRFPEQFNIPNVERGNDVISRFIASLKSKIAHSQKRSNDQGSRTHPTFVNFVWCHEYGQQGQSHYHAVILLNRQAYNNLGSFKSEYDNLYKRLVAAWASAIGVAATAAGGLVNISKDGVFLVDRGDPKSVAELYKRASYLTKVDTKRWGDGRRSFGGSRNLMPQINRP